MDDRRFDALTRTIAGQAWTRRRALQGVVGGALAAVLTRVGLEEADAACVKPGRRGCRGPHPKPCCPGAKCQGGNKTRPGRCVCKPGRTKCGATCVNTQTNAKHCGGCHQPCGAGQACLGGTCAGGGPSGCSSGTTLCGPSCVNTQSNDQHCGGCNTPCGAGQNCQGGTCVGGGGGGCAPGCTGGQTCQGGNCACPAGTANSCDFAWPPGCHCCPVGLHHCGDGACHECCLGANCGGGGRYCGPGNICRCPNAQENCNGICKSCCSAEHCRAQGSEQYICNTTLNPPGGEFCACNSAGWQGCPKASGTGYYCPDLDNDESNCGQCGLQCLVGTSCIDRICVRT